MKEVFDYLNNLDIKYHIGNHPAAYTTEEADKYMSEINSLKDLLQFPLDHCINGGEYTDFAAKAAYCAKMKEFI